MEIVLVMHLKMIVVYVQVGYQTMKQTAIKIVQANVLVIV